MSEQVPKEKSLEILKKCCACIPLICEAEIADDIQTCFRWAIAEIERLAGECVNWKQLHDADEACIEDFQRQLREAKERRAAHEPKPEASKERVKHLRERFEGARKS